MAKGVILKPGIRILKALLNSTLSHALTGEDGWQLTDMHKKALPALNVGKHIVSLQCDDFKLIIERKKGSGGLPPGC